MTAAFSSRRWVATAMLAALTLPALAQTQAPAPAAAQAASAPARKAGDMAQRYQALLDMPPLPTTKSATKPTT